MDARKIASRTLVFVSTLLPCAAAEAQVFRAYLASDGSDANPCTLPQPCRLLPAALSKVVSGGEIWMLDSANFNTGPVTINQSVSILAVPGAVGSVVAVGGPAIVVPVPALKVALRNLVIVPVVGGAGATNGVEVTAASSVVIEGSVIANMPTHGVKVLGGGFVQVIDSTLRNNALYGISLGCDTNVEVVGSKLINHNVALHAFCDAPANTQASLLDSTIIGGVEGIVSWANGMGANVRVFVTRSSIVRNQYGIDVVAAANSTALAAVSYSIVTNNTTAWYISGSGATIRSLGNNHMTDNGPGSGTLTAAALQ